MIRAVDLFLSSIGILMLAPVIIGVAFFGYFDTGSPIFIQTRVGRNQVPFKLLKIRTMAIGTPSQASHLVDGSAVTRFGFFLRRTKLDELPQLWNVLKGEMSLVGPRPGLFNQKELTQARERFGVFRVRPGITGLAQIHGIDMSNPSLLAQTDAKMIENMNLITYFALILQTLKGRGSGDQVDGS